MTQPSTIFFNDMTIIDFSIVTTDGMLVGGSAQLSLDVTGDVDSEEGVVIDFSQGKELIKQWIDGEGGFDHKCWVNTTDPNVVITTDNGMVTVKHRRGGLSVTAHWDAFTFVGANPEQDIEQFLNDKLEEAGIGCIVKNVTLSFEPINVPRADTAACGFRYVHGLKYSSSYGCKNIVHGHKSFISASVHEGADLSVVEKVLMGISTDLHNAIFVHTEDVSYVDEVGCYTISYTTKERGMMSMTAIQKMIFLETQTTVEHIVEYIRARYYDQLKVVGVNQLFVSEGLSKGASVTI